VGYHAVRASLALNPMGSIQRLPPIIRSTAAYAPPEVVDGKLKAQWGKYALSIEPAVRK